MGGTSCSPSQRTGVQNLFWQAADGTGPAEPFDEKQ